MKNNNNMKNNNMNNNDMNKIKNTMKSKFY